ncbi:MAG: tRNA lysidine(34) synthetase TilS [Roseburia sp.]|nr:tRNA lysidine(34) synthetase TilS [Roseburia sp.]
MLKPQDIVVAGISGGADSVCLLFLLLAYARRTAITIAVVHVNHGIRKEAFQDAEYVEKLCREQGLAFYLREADVPGRAYAEGLSEEEAGRKVRYEAFFEVAAQLSAENGRPVKIAVAHHAGDRAETMLFHLFRGSGLKGLGSIRPVRDAVIRPLLCLEREEIEAYLQACNRSFCRDSTNEKDDYTRNRIRHHILPYAEEHISRGVIRHLCQSAELLAETEDYLSRQTDRALKECIQESGQTDGAKISDRKVILRIQPFLALPVILQKRALLYMLQQLSPGQKDIAYIHVTSLQGLFTGESGKGLNFPFGIIARREYENVILEVCKECREAEDLQLLVDGAELSKNPLQLSFQGRIFVFRLLEGQELMKKNRNIPQNKYTKWFDYDKIKESLILRTRQTGDYLTIRGKDGSICHKSLKNYMITEKIPRQERTTIPLLAAGSHVLWLAGYRISEAVKINENTNRILQVQLMEGAPES